MKRHDLVLICDLDNTLYDWVSYFVPALYAMVKSASTILDANEELILDELRSVHQRHSDSEHPFALLETEIVQKKFGPDGKAEAYAKLNPAFYAFNSTRKKKLRLYPGVTDVLGTLRASGVRVLAHTESRFYAAADRVHRLGLTAAIERIYCREETTTRHPDPSAAREWLHSRDIEKFVKLPPEDLKPNPRVLFDICAAESIDIKNVVYLGDSIAKDVLMAKRAGALAVWAKYGNNHDGDTYARLVRVSHWTDADVERELRLRSEAKNVKPDHVCENSIFEILKIFPSSENAKNPIKRTA